MRSPVLAMLLAAAMIIPAAPVGARGFFTFSVVRAQQTAGQQLFAEHCMACHGRAGVAAGLGPTLIGVVGRRAGSVPGFPYSHALKNSGIVWTEDNLLKWIADAPGMVPGTLMPHVSITDPVERLYLRAYLRTLTPGGREQ